MSWPSSNQHLNLGLLYIMTFQFSSCLFYLLDAFAKSKAGPSSLDSGVRNQLGCLPRRLEEC